MGNALEDRGMHSAGVLSSVCAPSSCACARSTIPLLMSVGSLRFLYGCWSSLVHVGSCRAEAVLLMVGKGWSLSIPAASHSVAVLL
jgi:hypothetical protein